MTTTHRRNMWLELPGLAVHRDKIVAIECRYLPYKRDEKAYVFSITLRNHPGKYATSDVTLEETVEIWKKVSEFLNEPPRGPINTGDSIEPAT